MNLEVARLEKEIQLIREAGEGQSQDTPQMGDPSASDQDSSDVPMATVQQTPASGTNKQTKSKAQRKRVSTEHMKIINSNGNKTQ